jgi:hypothetical protein
LITGGKHTAPSFGLLSLSAFLARSLHLVTYLSPLLPSALVPDLHTDARALTLRDISLWAFARQLWRSDWAEGRDATPWDCTFAAAEARDDEFERFRRRRTTTTTTTCGAGRCKTWYRSYVMIYVSLERAKIPFFSGEGV